MLDLEHPTPRAHAPQKPTALIMGLSPTPLSHSRHARPTRPSRPSLYYHTRTVRYHARAPPRNSLMSHETTTEWVKVRGSVRVKWRCLASLLASLLGLTRFMKPGLTPPSDERCEEFAVKAFQAVGTCMVVTDSAAFLTTTFGMADRQRPERVNQSGRIPRVRED